MFSTYVDLKGGYRNVLFGKRRGGRGKGGPKLLLDQPTPSSSSLKVTRKKKETKGGGGGREDKQTYKIINQFGNKSDPGIAVMLQ